MAHPVLARVLPLLLALALAVPATAIAGWPTLPLPDDARAFGNGDTMVVDGRAMRGLVFVSERSPAVLADWFERHLGGAVSRTSRRGVLILGRPQGHYYLSVRLEPAGNGGTRGYVGVGDLRPDPAAARDQAFARRLLAVLPPETRLLRQVRSSDPGATALELILAVPTGVALASRRLETALSEAGLQLERDSGRGGRRVLTFAAPGRHAMAVVSTSADGNSGVVLEVIAQADGALRP